MEVGAREDLLTLGRVGVGYWRGKLEVGDEVRVGYWGEGVRLGYWG